MNFHPLTTKRSKRVIGFQFGFILWEHICGDKHENVSEKSIHSIFKRQFIVPKNKCLFPSCHLSPARIIKFRISCVDRGLRANSQRA